MSKRTETRQRVWVTFTHIGGPMDGLVEKRHVLNGARATTIVERAASDVSALWLIHHYTLTSDPGRKFMIYRGVTTSDAEDKPLSE